MNDTSAAAPVQRRPVHLRRITCQAYERDDGLFDIEGTLLDTKPTALALPERELAPGEPIHRMTVRIAVDRDFHIHEADARTLNAPYGVCGDIAESYRRLVGLRIQPGFTKSIKRLFGGVAGCSHITELLPPMATVAFQVLWAEPDAFGAPADPAGRRRTTPLGGCHALRLDGEVVRLHFPRALRALEPSP